MCACVRPSLWVRPEHGEMTQWELGRMVWARGKMSRRNGVGIPMACLQPKSLFSTTRFRSVSTKTTDLYSPGHSARLLQHRDLQKPQEFTLDACVTSKRWSSYKQENKTEKMKDNVHDQKRRRTKLFDVMRELCSSTTRRTLLYVSFNNEE